jgi:hypothetical protein
MSGHNLVTSSNASCWRTTHGGKKVKQPFIFKLTQQHTNNWEVGILFRQCTIFPPIDVLPFRYGQIYNILSNDKQYNVTIENFLHLHVYILLQCWQLLWVAMGHMCNVNMCTTSRSR